MRLPIIAPGNVEECFYGAIAAINWAERYQGPVILLSEHALSERNQNIPKPDLSKLFRLRSGRSITATNGYQRYDSWELSPMPIPGSPGSYVANGSEHDGMGDTTHLPERHIQMTHRRFSKLKLLEDGTYESRNAEAPVAVMPWGGSKGPAQAAYEEIIGGRWRARLVLHDVPASTSCRVVGRAEAEGARDSARAQLPGAVFKHSSLIRCTGRIDYSDYGLTVQSKRDLASRISEDHG